MGWYYPSEWMDVIQPGKVNMIIDGQFGSTGKGLIASAIAMENHIDLAIGRLSPNAGHTFYWDGKKCVSKMLPVAGIIQKRTGIHLSAGSVIDVDRFFQEIEEFDIDPSKVTIHPRAAIVTPEDKEEEQDQQGVKTIASTQSGTGAARASKIMRKNPLAMNEPRLKEFIYPEYWDLSELERAKLCVLVESGQGLDLGLNFGYQYPNCTSIDVIPAAILGDIGAHPTELGKVIMSMRTYPIRVGNITEDGEMVGYSGDVHPDSREISWDDLDMEPELTTVTHRPRRIFTFSQKQYEKSLYYIRPDYVFLNFVNYLTQEDIHYKWFKKMMGIRKPDFVGVGPEIKDVYTFDDWYAYMNK